MYGGDAIVGDLDVLTFNLVVSSILKWLAIQICKVDALPAPFSVAQ
jgi:hypothetical protein